MRVSTLNLKNVKSALAHRSAILKSNIQNAEGVVKNGKASPFSEDVRMISQRKLKMTLLTPTEKDELVPKYESGMSMMAIARMYGCHYTTVGRILRQKGVSIRE